MLKERTEFNDTTHSKHHPELVISRRNLPHWNMEGAWYYVTFCAQSGVMSQLEIQYVVNHIKNGHPKFYRLIAACVMPDHVHAVLSPRQGISLSRIMNGIKSPTARALNAGRGTQGAFWQDERWDRIIRDDAELLQKLGYMMDNPVKEGLVEDPWEYPGWYLNTDSQSTVARAFSPRTQAESLRH